MDTQTEKAWKNIWYLYRVNTINHHINVNPVSVLSNFTSTSSRLRHLINDIGTIYVSIPIIYPDYISIRFHCRFWFCAYQCNKLGIFLAKWKIWSSMNIGMCKNTALVHNWASSCYKPQTTIFTLLFLYLDRIVESILRVFIDSCTLLIAELIQVICFFW